ncbi:MAG TPA: tetratricopeptide repeat protein [Myxococcota bacterium]|nr:tetratricopeptide repeat protein [Myxococcota bacterium]
MPPAALTTADVARVLGVSAARVRGFVRAGWCAPQRSGRALAFSFQDLVVLRAAKSLHEARVPAGRVRRALRALARELPEHGGALSGLRIAADGRRVVVHHDGARFEPESGQLLLDFSLDALAEEAAKVVGAEVVPARAKRSDPRAPLAAGALLANGESGSDPVSPSGPRALAERAFAEALALEESDPAGAMRAYRRALARDASFSDAAMNLARLLHEAGRPKDAVALYQQALAHAPGDAELHYNLALALEDTRGAGAAIHHYEHAVALDPGFADAHWNLAGLLEAAGRKQEALRHYRAYEKLTR